MGLFAHVFLLDSSVNYRLSGIAQLPAKVGDSNVNMSLVCLVHNCIHACIVSIYVYILSPFAFSFFLSFSLSFSLSLCLSLSHEISQLHSHQHTHRAGCMYGHSDPRRPAALQPADLFPRSRYVLAGMLPCFIA